MKKSILFALCALLFMASCNKDDEVNMKLSGELKVSVMDKSGNPIADEAVFLYSSAQLMDSKKTNSEGVVDFGTLIVGNYIVELNDVKIDSLVYSLSQGVAVTIGNTVNLSIVPEAYVGSIVFTAREEVSANTQFDPLAGVDVYLLKELDVNDYFPNIDKLIELSIDKGKTSSEGTVEFENVPCKQNFHIVYYNGDKEDFEIYSSTGVSSLSPINIEKNETFEARVTFEYYSLTANFTGASVAGLKVFLLTAEDYAISYRSITSMKSVATKNGLTDSAGQIVFEKLTSGNYTLIYYSDESNYRSENITIYNTDNVTSISSSL